MLICSNVENRSTWWNGYDIQAAVILWARYSAAAPRQRMPARREERDQASADETAPPWTNGQAEGTKRTRNDAGATVLLYRRFGFGGLDLRPDHLEQRQEDQDDCDDRNRTGNRTVEKDRRITGRKQQ